VNDKLNVDVWNVNVEYERECGEFVQAARCRRWTSWVRASVSEVLKCFLVQQAAVVMTILHAVQTLQPRQPLSHYHRHHHQPPVMIVTSVHRVLISYYATWEAQASKQYLLKHT